MGCLGVIAGLFVLGIVVMYFVPLIYLALAVAFFYAADKYPGKPQPYLAATGVILTLVSLAFFNTTRKQLRLEEAQRVEQQKREDARRAAEQKKEELAAEREAERQRKLEAARAPRDLNLTVHGNEDVKVAVYDPNGSLVTDISGSKSILSLAPGKYKVVAGYEADDSDPSQDGIATNADRQSLWVNIPQNKNIAFTLKNKPVEPVYMAPTPSAEPEYDEEDYGDYGDDVYYDNCSEARAAGVTPIYVGEPGYASHLDRDSDGIACE